MKSMNSSKNKLNSKKNSFLSYAKYALPMIFLFREFQLLVFIPDDSSLSLNQATNQFLA